MDLRKGMWLGVLAFGLSGASRADTVFLADGGELNGTVLEANDRTVVIKSAGGTVRSVRRADVVEIVYDRARKDAQLVNSSPTEAPAKKEEPAAPAAPEAKAETAKKDAPKKDETAKKDDKDKDKKEEPGAAAEDEADLAELNAWKAPANMPGFPKYAKRLDEKKEARFLELLNMMATVEEQPRRDAKAEIAGMGVDVLPYLAFGINHQNAEARTAAMSLIAEVGGKGAVKQVIEVLYAALPEGSVAPPYQRAFVKAGKETLAAITGQSFINVEADKPAVHEGLAKYVEWYKQKYEEAYSPNDKLIGDPPVPETNKKFGQLIKDSRALKLERREWVRPPQPADEAQGGTNVPKNNDRPNLPPEISGSRDADKKYLDTIPKVKRDALDRGR